MKPPTLADLREAIAWALRDMPPARVERAVGAILDVWVMGECQSARENRIAAILAQMGIDGDARRAALVALGAEAAGDRDGFFLRAFAVFDVYRQSRRAASRRGGDALDGLLRKLINELPDFSPALLWAEFCRRASSPQIKDEALVSYDSMTNTLAFEPHPGAEFQDINYPAFRKRYSRIKKSLGHKPAHVPLDREDANNPPRLAA